MPSDLKLTAAGILAHVLETSGIQVGTTIDRKDLENMAASLDGQLSALIAAAKREAEPRCPECNGELSSCGTATIDGPSTDCRACLLNDLLRAMQARTTSAEQRAVAAEGRVKELAQALGSMLYICGQRLMVANPRNDTHGHKYAEQVIAEGKAVIARTALAQPPEELYRTELENDELNRQQANRQIQEENP